MSMATRKALYTKLTTTSGVTTLLATSTSVFHGQAPPNAAYPYIILNKQSNRRTRAFNATAFEDETWMVKAVDRNTTSDTAEAIRNAVATALTNGTLTITGRTVQDLYPIGDIDYLETEGDQTYRHHGLLFRIVTT
jgi:DNA-binding LytR/AlgR family response regulator